VAMFVVPPLEERDFTRLREKKDLYLNGQKIVWKEEVKHLGSIVTNACVDDSDCKY
jgi:hypothetical protein